MERMNKNIWIIGIVCIIGLIALGVNRFNNNKKIDEIPLPKVDDSVTIEASDIGFCYCIFYPEERDYKWAVEKKENVGILCVEDVVNRYLKISGLDKVTLNDVKQEQIMAEKQLSENCYLSKVNTYHIYLQNEGSALEEGSIRGLVNSIMSYTDTIKGLEYVKVYVDDTEVFAYDKMYDYGYTYYGATTFYTQNHEREKDRLLYKKSEGNEVEVTFKLVDKEGQPVRNMAYYVEDYYFSDTAEARDAITDGSGGMKLKVIEGNDYVLRIQRCNSIEMSDFYGKDKIYEEMVVCFEAKSGLNQQLVWDDESVISLSEPDDEDKVLIDISDVYEGNYEEVLLKVRSKRNYHTIGYLGKNGTIVWNEPEELGDEGLLVLSVKDELTYYYVEFMDGKANILGVCEEDYGIAE